MKHLLLLSILFSTPVFAKKYKISKKVMRQCVSEAKEMAEEEVISNRDYPDYMKVIRLKVKSVNKDKKFVTFFVVVRSAYNDLGDEAVYTDKFIVINRFDKHYCEFLDIKKVK